MKGYIFRCNNKTYEEVMSRKLLGEERVYLPIVESITEVDLLFLYNLSTFEITGPLKPIGLGAKNIVPQAWKSAFPAQIRFETLTNTKTIPFRLIEKVINKYHKGIYPDMELDINQLSKIQEVINDK